MCHRPRTRITNHTPRRAGISDWRPAARSRELVHGNRQRRPRLEVVKGNK
jgi:hypothetical protein